jgi:hypothetical protein
LWVAVEHAPNQALSPTRARLKFVFSANGIIDLVSVLPFWFGFLVPSELRVILVFRIVRFLKLARYSPAIRSLLDALYSERRALFGCVVILIGAALIAAALMHLAERNVQPDIAAGEVAIDTGSKQVRLGVGHFFGEVAVLRGVRRRSQQPYAPVCWCSPPKTCVP